MLAAERRKYILNYLSEKSSVSVAELSEALKLSEVSVRKLLVAMEQEGQLKRTWGGAVSAYGSLSELSHEEKETKHLEEKRAIARAAYNCINDGDAIFMDSGTTTMQLAKLIVSGHKRNVLVCTNTLNIALEFVSAPDIQVIVTGGEFRHKIRSCVGYLAQQALNHLYFDRGFITGNHFTLEHGFTTPNMQEAEMKRTVLTVSKSSYVLMDYSKYGDDSLALIAPANAVDNIITDWHAPEELASRFMEKGVKVIVGHPL